MGTCSSNPLVRGLLNTKPPEMAPSYSSYAALVKDKGKEKVSLALSFPGSILGSCYNCYE